MAMTPPSDILISDCLHLHFCALLQVAQRPYHPPANLAQVISDHVPLLLPPSLLLLLLHITVASPHHCQGAEPLNYHHDLKTTE